jgi:hypothetical protein
VVGNLGCGEIFYGVRRREEGEEEEELKFL